MKGTFDLSLVSRGHDFPASAFRKQHNTDLSVRLCLEPCVEQREMDEGFEGIKHVVELQLCLQVTYFGVNLPEKFHSILLFDLICSSDAAVR